MKIFTHSNLFIQETFFLFIRDLLSTEWTTDNLKLMRNEEKQMYLFFENIFPH